MERGDPLSRLDSAWSDFTPLPRTERRTPARRRTISGDLYLDRYREHREAAEFLDQMMRIAPGAGVKTMVKALLHYRDTVMRPLETRLKAAGAARQVAASSRRA